MAVLYQYPLQTEFNRVVPKSKIYAHANPSERVRDLFVSQVEQIVWSHKLATETVNLAATRDVPEIQVFNISLRSADFDESVLRTIDKAIPFPIIHELYYGKRVRIAAAYKRPSEAEKAKWVTDLYFQSPWMAQATVREPLPIVLNLAGLYERLLLPLADVAPRKNESLQALVERVKTIRARQTELKTVEQQLRRERQFKNKVDLNGHLRGLRRELDALFN